MHRFQEMHEKMYLSRRVCVCEHAMIDLDRLHLEHQQQICVSPTNHDNNDNLHHDHQIV